MSNDESPTAPAPLGNGYLPSVMAWQRSADAVRRALMDPWICRFGGGVPLDS
ncbi:hypothetical protein J2W37_002244 [Variovorax paradoxus]|uniref:hypothetical protein n=1 Tax=Variovorax paradoxus TaxID=34073 RepID=UPI001AE16F21|nr:hypothetical protein [Variovorax paradoxus]MDP9964524.1 hypothetical protein [Variovorax paradoxus]